MQYIFQNNTSLDYEASLIKLGKIEIIQNVFPNNINIKVNINNRKQEINKIGKLTNKWKVNSDLKKLMGNSWRNTITKI